MDIHLNPSAMSCLKVNSSLPLTLVFAFFCLASYHQTLPTLHVHKCYQSGSQYTYCAYFVLPSPVASFPLAAQSSADLSNFSEVDSIPIGKYNYVFIPSCCVLSSSSGWDRRKIKSAVGQIL